MINKSDLEILDLLDFSVNRRQSSVSCNKNSYNSDHISQACVSSIKLQPEISE
jgi:hypothetical protein